MPSATSTYTLWPKDVEYEQAILAASMQRPSSSRASKQGSMGMSRNGTVHHRANPMFNHQGNDRKRAHSDPDNNRSALLKRPSFLRKAKSEIVPIKLSVVAEDIRAPAPPPVSQTPTPYRPAEYGRRPSVAPSPAPSAPLPPPPSAPPAPTPYHANFPPQYAYATRNPNDDLIFSPRTPSPPTLLMIPETHPPRIPSLKLNDRISWNLTLQIPSPQRTPSPQPVNHYLTPVSENEAHPEAIPAPLKIKKSKSQAALRGKKVRFSDAAPEIIPAGPHYPQRPSTSDGHSSEDKRRPSWASVFLLTAPPPPLSARPRLPSPSRHASVSVGKPQGSAKSILRPVSSAPNSPPTTTHDLNPNLKNLPRSNTGRGRRPGPLPCPPTPPKDHSPSPSRRGTEKYRTQPIIISLPSPTSSPEDAKLFEKMTLARPPRSSSGEREARSGGAMREHASEMQAISRSEGKWLKKGSVSGNGGPVRSPPPAVPGLPEKMLAMGA